MGLTSQLIPALVCLLACTSNFTHGHKYNLTLRETIKTLNILTAKKDPRCMELTVADVLAAPKNTTEEETFCRAATALRQVYRHHTCLTKRFLSGLDRNLSSMANKVTASCRSVAPGGQHLHASMFLMSDLLSCERSQDDDTERLLGKVKEHHAREILKGLKLDILIYEFLIALF
ncbi:hypothetical protein QTO34_016060 [Cnephaeus nilssonii]|uniref:Interleukin-4 n=1 Tax=Cnephaeus nilssonii TaxID=3371016 RepID=A0AA40I591_CNENI|nr:hypothetical protein QTO34_016060 [Eptesicus nilssonii]